MASPTDRSDNPGTFRNVPATTAVYPHTHHPTMERRLDSTFRLEIAVHKHEAQPGLGPRSDHQFFGEVSIRGGSGTMTVRLLDRNGSLLHTQTLLPGQPR